MENPKIVERKLTDITPYENNPRKNDAAVDAVANSIREFGFKVPIVIDKDGTIVCGHTRFKACQKLGIKTVPCIIASDLTPEQVKAFRLADNKTAELAGWDFLGLEQELFGIGDKFEMHLFGFEEADVPLDLSEFETDEEVKPKEPKKTVCPNCGHEF